MGCHLSIGIKGDQIPSTNPSVKPIVVKKDISTSPIQNRKDMSTSPIQEIHLEDVENDINPEEHKTNGSESKHQYNKNRFKNTARIASTWR